MKKFTLMLALLLIFSTCVAVPASAVGDSPVEVHGVLNLTDVSLAIIADASAQQEEQSLSDVSKTNLDGLDVVVAAHYFLSADNDDCNLWPETAIVQTLIPLYTPNGKVCAYYLKFLTGEYAVINNNKENPVAIEFGVGGNNLIEDILEKDTTAQLIYNNPTDISVVSNTSTRSTESGTPNIYAYYADLNKSNSELSERISSQRDLIERASEGHVSPQGDGDYGFIYSSELDSTGYYGNSLNNPAKGVYLSNITWAVMSNYDSDVIKNHCGATCITNMAQYFVEAGYSNAASSSVSTTFYDVYSFIGNGPVAPSAFKSGAKSYFSRQNYTLENEGCGSFEGVKTAIAAGDPCAILLSDAVNNWHWVLCVGWREYSQYDQYMQIVNGWESNCNVYYKPYSGSTWMSGIRFWIE